MSETDPRDVPNVIDQALGFPGWITDLQIDLVHSTITYHVLEEGDERRPRTVIFSGVTAFYYVRGPGVHRFAAPWQQELAGGTWAVSEWTSTGYYPQGVGLTTVQAGPDGEEREWLCPIRAIPNFAIEQLAGLFLIEANRVQVDEQIFDVGYPSDPSDLARQGGTGFGTYSE